MMNRAYDPFDLKGVDAPRLNDGDQVSKDVFRVNYLEYLEKHNTKMRKRAPRDRVLPQSVVECSYVTCAARVCMQTPFEGGVPERQSCGGFSLSDTRVGDATT